MNYPHIIHKIFKGTCLPGPLGGWSLPYISSSCASSCLYLLIYSISELLWLRDLKRTVKKKSPIFYARGSSWIAVLCKSWESTNSQKTILNAQIQLSNKGMKIINVVQLRDLALLPEELGSVPNPTWWLSRICNSSSMGSDGLLWPP